MVVWPECYLRRVAGNTVYETASRHHLRSAASSQLTVPPQQQVTYNGGRAFAVAGPTMWNSLAKRLQRFFRLFHQNTVLLCLEMVPPP